MFISRAMASDLRASYKKRALVLEEKLQERIVRYINAVRSQRASSDMCIVLAVSLRKCQ